MKNSLDIEQVMRFTGGIAMVGLGAALLRSYYFHKGCTIIVEGIRHYCPDELESIARKIGVL